MAERLDIVMGEHDDQMIPSVVANLGKADIRIDCNVNGTPPNEAIVHIRRKIEQAFRRRVVIETQPDLRHLQLPARPLHAHADIRPGWLLEEEPARQLAPFFKQFGAWYALRQMREADCEKLWSRMEDAIERQLDTAGCCNEYLFQITLEMLRSPLRHDWAWRRDLFMPGLDKNATPEGRHILQETLPHRTACVSVGRTNIDILNGHDERIAEFDGCIILRGRRKTRIILLDAMKSENRGMLLHEWIEDKEQRNRYFLERDVDPRYRDQFAFVTVATVHPEEVDGNFPPSVITAGGLDATRWLEKTMLSVMQSNAADKYLLFRKLLDRE